MTRNPYLRIGALALVLLAGVLSYVDTDFVSVLGMRGTLNDQAGYISVARHLSESGELRSSIVYPSLLTHDKPSDTPYVPGHYFALASSFFVFGYSPLASFLPSLLSYLVGAIALLSIAMKLHDRTTGTLAAILFLTFPPSLIYACTAMAEMTFVAAGLVAMAIFVHAPAERRPFLGPFLILLPVLFRETGAIFLLPMAALIIEERRITWKRDVVLMVLASLVLVPLVPFVIFGDRPSFFAMNLLGVSRVGKYLDAYALDAVTLSAADLPGLLWQKTSTNLGLLWRPRNPDLLDNLCFWLMLSSIPVGIALAVVKRSLLLLSYAGASLGVFVSLLSTYELWGYVGVRNMMICLPFISFIFAEGLQFLTPPPHREKLLAAALGVGLLFGGWGTWSAFNTQAYLAELEGKMTAFLERLGHDDDRLLVSPFWISMSYVLDHHPMKWSFIPANEETLRLLGEKYDIGTLVVPFDHSRVALRWGDTSALDFKVIGQYRIDGTMFWVFRKPRPGP